MPAVVRQLNLPETAPPVVAHPQSIATLGLTGPFPDAPMRQVLERRWLHYAFLSRDDELAMVANVAWLGPDAERPAARTRNTSILLLYRRGRGWHASQFNAETALPLWSSFRRPHPVGHAQPLELAATARNAAVRLMLQRSSHPCTSQCAPFARNQHFRWQSETGVIARGDWRVGGERLAGVEAVGYHERVRGYWGWPEMGGWVFGFANDPRVTAPTVRGAAAPPPTAVVFTLIQPPAPDGAASASVMLWRDGRLRRHFPRRNISVAVDGSLDRNRVTMTPELAKLFAVPPMPPIPARLHITAQLGSDWLLIAFRGDSAARIVIPNETGLDPFSVHEVVGPCEIEGELNSRSFSFKTYGIVEFAGGAGGI